MTVIAFPWPSAEVIDFNDSVANLVEEVTIVGYNKLRALEIGKKSLEPFCGLNVKVVCWLVKEDDIDP